MISPINRLFLFQDINFLFEYNGLKEQKVRMSCLV
jgi:hypothetical protein